MQFITDKQTLADLNILGKYKTRSMFNLFNRVKTRGGELLLEEMFRSPLTNASEINQRAARIRYLQQTGITLCISGSTAEDALQYLTEKKPASRLSSIVRCFREKAQEMFYHSSKLQLHQRQLSAVQEVLQVARGLLKQLLNRKEEVNPCQVLQDRLEEIIKSPDLIQLKAKYPYTLRQTAQCHYLFLNKHRAEIQELLRILHEFDVYISVAEVAAETAMTYAYAKEHTRPGTLIDVENLKHPSLNNAVGNSISLSTEQNLLFLTGANMAGKSTWMKTLGVSFYLAHMGFPVAADRMTFGVMEGIFTSINVPDDISIGWSHFYAEVMRVKMVSQEVGNGKRLFVLFDELFKGTNVKDAFDATLAVTRRLARYRNCAFVISTHIIEVGQELLDVSTLLFRYMPTVMKDAVPQYTYHLTEGITTDRQGMIIIENEKILEMLE
jgi:DNA mismatch repair ATPase MutS